MGIKYWATGVNAKALDENYGFELEKSVHNTRVYVRM